MTAPTIEAFARFHDYEITDLTWDEPRPRTATACNVEGCPCREFVDGQLISGYVHCIGDCNHTEQNHQPKKAKKKARRA